MKRSVYKVLIVLALVSAPLFLRAAIVTSTTFEAGGTGTLTTNSADRTLGLETLVSLQPVADAESSPLLHTEDAFILDQRYQAILRGGQEGWVALPLGPSKRGPLGIGLAAVLFIIFATRKLYLLSR